MKQNLPSSQGIQTLERASHILDAIKNNEQSLTLTELSRKIGMSKNNLKKYLVTFANLGVLTLDEEKKTYDLGPKLIELGLSALNSVSIYSIIDPFMQRIKNELNQSSAFVIWTEKGPMISKYQGSGKSINVEIEVGYCPPLLKSSVGRCFAAFLPAERTRNIMDKEMKNYDLNSKIVMDDLHQIKKAGFSSRDKSFGDLPGSHSISSPIFDYSGEMVAAICIIGFANDLGIDEKSNDVKSLQEITRQISRQLAYKN